ncbi:MAG TPA: alpha/beta fold hydrolase [Gemmatimonadota bacterium]|nr:alpha/beta fold hydrolase [Gemmatimonadota bacterium]
MGAEFLRLHRQVFRSYPTNPTFLADGERFWFAAGPAGRRQVVLVDPRAGTAQPLLDVPRTREALAAAGAELEGPGLPLEEFEWLDEEETHALLTVPGGLYVLDLGTYEARPAPDSLRLARDLAAPRPLRGGLFLHSPPIREVPSPDDRWLATIHEGDLWLRSATSPDSVRLTSDAVPDYSWDLEGARWSPDGRYLAAYRVDRRDVPAIPLVAWTESGTPVEWYPYSMVGEPIPRHELYVFDTHDGTRVRAELGEGDEPYIPLAGWHDEGRELYVFRMNRLMDRFTLLAVEPTSGKSSVVLDETSETFLWGLPFLHGYTRELHEQKIAVPLPGDRLLWTSDRDGIRRLYLYAADGTLLRTLTPDSLLVRRVEAVNEDDGWAYFVASNPRASDPYRLSLYRVGLDGGAPAKLLEAADIVDVRLTRSGDFLTLSRADMDLPPRMELRRSDGTLVRTLWAAEMPLLDEVGWTPPEPFEATAADGVTEIHGLLIRPTHFDPERRYPVIEHIYAGPQTTHRPVSLAYRDLWINQWLAEHGFVVVVIDGRGTPGRGKAFQDVVHGRFGQFEIEDHAAALRQAAASRPYMNLERVGIYGHSWGGYFATRALLTHPELYRVAVALAPAVDLSRMRVPAEAFMGCLPETCPEAYAAGDNTALAHALEGRLLMMHGSHDTHIPFAEPMRMVDALRRAGKPYDLLVFPGANHISFLFDLYPFFRTRDYFVEHLRPEAPPESGADGR